MTASLLDFFTPGARVFAGGLSGESALLAEQLAAAPERAAGVIFSAVQFPGVDRTDYLALHPQARAEAFFMTPALRDGIAAGRARVLALDYAGIARHLLEGPPFDVVVGQFTPPDADGWCAPGLAADMLPLVWARARRRVAHLNARLPRLASSWRVHVSAFDVAVQAERPLLEWPEPGCGAVESQISERVAALVRDGDTLQFGIGSVPVALAGALVNHRRLRLHGGLVSAAVMRLWQAGALDRDARITTGVVLGDAAFHAAAAALPRLWLDDVRQTHGLAAIAETVRQHDSRFIAINSALAVDLFGQVNAERVGGTIQAGAGGLPNYAQAAAQTPGGRLLICLASTARGGSTSRIVPALGADDLVTLPRQLADAVITEHGVAELRGLAPDERAEALLAIAAPPHRAALAEAWNALRRRL